jgi:aminomethyltransferase
MLEGTTPADEGADLLQNGEKVGVVTYGMYSEVNNHNVGIARMPVDCAKPGTALTVRNGDGTEIAATAEEMPFYDKDKSIRTAKG